MAVSESNGQDGKPKLTRNQWIAVKFEFQSVAAGNWKTGSFDPVSGVWTGSWPSSKSANQVAKLAGVSRKSVAQWRRGDPVYLRGLLYIMACQVSKNLARQDANSLEREHTDQSRADMHVQIKNSWPGSVRSPIDEKIYTDPDKYYLHILQSGGPFAKGEPALAKENLDPDVT